MNLPCSELHNLSELILSCVNSITTMALYKNEATDSELKSIIANHFPIHVQDYNMKVKFVKESTTPTENMPGVLWKQAIQNFENS